MFSIKEIKPQLLEKFKVKEEVIPYNISQKTVRKLKPLNKKTKRRRMSYRR